MRVVVQSPVSDRMPVLKFTKRSKPSGVRAASPEMASGPHPVHAVVTMFGPMNRLCAWGPSQPPASGIEPMTVSDAMSINDTVSAV